MGLVKLLPLSTHVYSLFNDVDLCCVMINLQVHIGLNCGKTNKETRMVRSRAHTSTEAERPLWNHIKIQ